MADMNQVVGLRETTRPRRASSVAPVPVNIWVGAAWYSTKYALLSRPDGGNNSHKQTSDFTNGHEMKME